MSEDNENPSQDELYESVVEVSYGLLGSKTGWNYNGKFYDNKKDVLDAIGPNFFPSAYILSDHGNLSETTCNEILDETDEEKEDRLQFSIDSKCIIARDGSRGRFLSNCLILDACGLLEQEVPEGIEEYSEPDENGNIYEIATEMETKLFEAGYTVISNDGYLIYKDLTDEENEYLNENAF